MSTGNCRKLLYLDSWLAFSRFLLTQPKRGWRARASQQCSLVGLPCETESIYNEGIYGSPPTQLRVLIRQFAVFLFFVGEYLSEKLHSREGCVYCHLIELINELL